MSENPTHIQKQDRSGTPCVRTKALRGHSVSSDSSFGLSSRSPTIKCMHQTQDALVTPVQKCVSFSRITELSNHEIKLTQHASALHAKIPAGSDTPPLSTVITLLSRSRNPNWLKQGDTEE